MANRQVNLIVLSKLAYDDAHAAAWRAALRYVREAGVAVVLLDPQRLPKRETLFAAVLRSDSDASAQSLDDVLVTVAADEPHARTISVRLD